MRDIHIIEMRRSYQARYIIQLTQIMSVIHDRSMMLSVTNCWSEWIECWWDCMLPVAMMIMRIAGTSARSGCHIRIIIHHMIIDVM